MNKERLATNDEYKKKKESKKIFINGKYWFKSHLSLSVDSGDLTRVCLKWYISYQRNNSNGVKVTKLKHGRSMLKWITDD